MNQQNELQITLHQAEIDSLLGVLGELPTKSNAWPLAMKIKAQAEAQLNAMQQAMSAMKGEDKPKAEPMPDLKVD